MADGYGNTENCIEWIRDQKRATLSLSQRSVISRVRKLAECRPEECEIVAVNEDGTICAHVPVSWIKISPSRQLTEEEREKLAERARSNFHND